MNINFADRPGFSAYVLLLMVSGAAMVLIGSPAVRNQRPLARLLNVAFGIGFFGYGFYLAFLFDGGHYVIFFKAFILPVVLIVRTLAAAGRRPAKAVPPAPAPPQWGAPTPPVQPQPQWAAPQPEWGPPPVNGYGAPARPATEGEAGPR